MNEKVLVFLRKFLFALKELYICYYIICMTVPLRKIQDHGVGDFTFSSYNALNGGSHILIFCKINIMTKTFMPN